MYELALTGEERTKGKKGRGQMMLLHIQQGFHGQWLSFANTKNANPKLKC